MKTIIICAVFVTLMGVAGCSGKAQKSTNNVSADALQPSWEYDSLMIEVSYKIFKANPELVSLLDTLYRHVYVPSDENTEEKLRWMRAYREQLCRYYDRNKLGSDTIPCHAKADTVLNHAEKLWETNMDTSTMGVIIYESTGNTWDTFRQYNSLLRLWDLCQDEKQRNLLMEEWQAWEKLRVEFKKLFFHCVDLCYWNGSMSGPIQGIGVRRILESHIKMNNQEIAELSGTEWKSFGVFLSCAEELFINCCNTAIKEYSNEEEVTFLDKEEESKLYQETYNNAIQQNKKIKPLLKDWIKARNEWSKEVTGGGIAFDYYQENTSEVLISLANIISSIY